MSKDSNKDDRPDPGVFLAKGMRVTIPEFSIRLTSEGQLESDPVQLHTGVDVCPVWFEIAVEHVEHCEAAASELKAARSANNAEVIAASLERELKSGMQAVTSSCTAVDAYYSMVKEHIEISAQDVQRWKENRTARYRQISEVLRRAFPISNERSKHICDILRQNFSWRDQAIHPHSGTRPPMLHVELNKATDQKYALFRFYNAQAIVKLNIAVVIETARNPSPVKFQQLRHRCADLVERLLPLESAWNRKYGSLLK